MLIAQPFMHDVPFRRSVILLCDYTREDGAIGFILNKPLNMQIDRLVADFPDMDSTAFYGGPVATNTIHYLHNYGDLLEGSTEVFKGVFWGGDFDKLKFLIDTKMISPDRIRFYVGYSGWSENQLEEELTNGSWVLDCADPNYIYKVKADNLWSEVMIHKGGAYAVMGQMPKEIAKTSLN